MERYVVRSREECVWRAGGGDWGLTILYTVREIKQLRIGNRAFIYLHFNYGRDQPSNCHGSYT